MRMIIDIPEEVYKSYCVSTYCVTDMIILENAIRNATPLDDVMAEIQAKYDSIPWRNNEYDDGWIEALEWVLFSILDNIGKTESEVKPNE